MWRDLFGAFAELAAVSRAQPMQIIAWQAAAFATLLTLTQLLLGLIRQHREDRRMKAKFGYELLDTLFSDAWSSEFLYGLDTKKARTTEGNHNKRRKSSEKAVNVASEFESIFVTQQKPLEDASDDLLKCMDATLYFFDRFEHAIDADLTEFDVVRTPTDYYVKLMVPAKSLLSRYITDIGYDRVLTFLKRFESWRRAPPRDAA